MSEPATLPLVRGVDNVRRPAVVQASRWKSWYWLAIPLLAALAYLRVLGVGFLSDDYVLLYQAQQSGIDPQIFIPQPHWFLYRPLGMMLVWQLGWQLWGFNALPFHIESLLLHAGISLLVGLWTANVVGNRSLGWLAGALFAVFPLHLEAVAWIAAQWDLLAAFLSLLSLWFFSLWWCAAEEHRPIFYWISVICYGMAIFTKESTLTLLPVFGVSAWLFDTRHAKRGLRKLALSLLPFVAFLGVNITLRLLYWGHLGGYGRDPMNYPTLFPVIWDQLITYVKLLLSPLNCTIFGPVTTQLVGILASLLILLGLIVYGRLQW